MASDKIVQFVLFETTLDSESFIGQWEQYKRSDGSNSDVIIHQSKQKKGFTYIAAHYCKTSEFKFTFSKARRSSHPPMIEIKKELLGGYYLEQAERNYETGTDENKVFLFLHMPPASMNLYKKMSARSALNIYRAYYENCQYTFILEFFVTDSHLDELLEKLNSDQHATYGVYKECLLQST